MALPPPLWAKCEEIDHGVCKCGNGGYRYERRVSGLVEMGGFRGVMRHNGPPLERCRPCVVPDIEIARFSAPVTHNWKTMERFPKPFVAYLYVDGKIQRSLTESDIRSLRLDGRNDMPPHTVTVYSRHRENG